MILEATDEIILRPDYFLNAFGDLISVMILELIMLFVVRGAESGQQLVPVVLSIPPALALLMLCLQMSLGWGTLRLNSEGLQYRQFWGMQSYRWDQVVSFYESFGHYSYYRFDLEHYPRLYIALRHIDIGHALGSYRYKGYNRKELLTFLNAYCKRYQPEEIVEQTQEPEDYPY